LCPYPQQVRFTGNVSVIGGAPVATNQKTDLADPTKYQCVAAQPWQWNKRLDRELPRTRISHVTTPILRVA
jgi:hypothetical protein